MGLAILFLVTGSCIMSQGWDMLLTAAPCRFVECDHVPLHPQVPLSPALRHPARAHLPHRGQHQEGLRVQPRGQHLAEGSGMRDQAQSPSWEVGAAPCNDTPHPLPLGASTPSPSCLLIPWFLLTHVEPKMAQSFFPCSCHTSMRSMAFALILSGVHTAEPHRMPPFPAEPSRRV